MEWTIKCPYCGALPSEATGRHKECRKGMQVFTYFCKCGKKYSFEIYAGGGSTSRNYGGSAQK